MVETLVGIAKRIGIPLRNSARDLLPIIAVISIFQLLVFRQPLDNLLQLLIGLVLVLIGLTVFVMGLELGLFPVGESMAQHFARKGSLGWLLAFAFALGFGTTFAEPGLITLANQAAELVVTEAPLDPAEQSQSRFALAFRLLVAIAVGCGLMIGVLRIVFGWKIHYLMIAGFLAVILLTPMAPPTLVAVAYDSGGVAISAVTVPLAAALGLGLASSIKGRNPLIDGFGLIGFASLTPLLLILMSGIFLL